MAAGRKTVDCHAFIVRQIPASIGKIRTLGASHPIVIEVIAQLKELDGRRTSAPFVQDELAPTPEH